MVRVNFFFYGSLMTRPPFVFNHREVVRKIPATIRGKLFVFNQCFPAAILGGTDELIHGVIAQYEFKQKEDVQWLFNNLDTWEGYWENRPDLSHYHRKMVPVEVDGEVYECWMYVTNTEIPHPSLDMNKQIPNGDYKRWVEGER